MAFLWGWNIVIHVCYIVLPVARIVPFATIVWSVLIITAPGWANALDWCAVNMESELFLFLSFVHTPYYSLILSFDCCLLEHGLLDIWWSVYACRGTIVTSFCLSPLQLFFASMCLPSLLTTWRFWWKRRMKAQYGKQWKNLRHQWY